MLARSEKPPLDQRQTLTTKAHLERCKAPRKEKDRVIQPISIFISMIIFRFPEIRLICLLPF